MHDIDDILQALAECKQDIIELWRTSLDSCSPSSRENVLVKTLSFLGSWETTNPFHIYASKTILEYIQHRYGDDLSTLLTCSFQILAILKTNESRGLCPKFFELLTHSIQHLSCSRSVTIENGSSTQTIPTIRLVKCYILEILQLQWNLSSLHHYLCMFKELTGLMAPSEQSTLIAKICAYLPQIKAEDLPSTIYHALIVSCNCKAGTKFQLFKTCEEIYFKSIKSTPSEPSFIAYFSLLIRFYRKCLFDDFVKYSQRKPFGYFSLLLLLSQPKSRLSPHKVPSMVIKAILDTEKTEDCFRRLGSYYLPSDTRSLETMKSLFLDVLNHMHQFQIEDASHSVIEIAIECFKNEHEKIVSLGLDIYDKICKQNMYMQPLLASRLLDFLIKYRFKAPTTNFSHCSHSFTDQTVLTSLFKRVCRYDLQLKTLDFDKLAHDIPGYALEFNCLSSYFNFDAYSPLLLARFERNFLVKCLQTSYSCTDQMVSYLKHEITAAHATMDPSKITNNCCSELTRLLCILLSVSFNTKYFAHAFELASAQLSVITQNINFINKPANSESLSIEKTVLNISYLELCITMAALSVEFLRVVKNISEAFRKVGDESWDMPECFLTARACRQLFLASLEHLQEQASFKLCLHILSKADRRIFIEPFFTKSELHAHLLLANVIEDEIFSRLFFQISLSNYKQEAEDKEFYATLLRKRLSRKIVTKLDIEIFSTLNTCQQPTLLEDLSVCILQDIKDTKRFIYHALCVLSSPEKFAYRIANSILQIRGKIDSETSSDDSLTTTEHVPCKFIGLTNCGMALSSLLSWHDEVSSSLNVLLKSNEDISIETVLICCQHLKEIADVLIIVAQIKLVSQEYRSFELLVIMMLETISLICEKYQTKSQSVLQPLMELLEGGVQKLIHNIYDMIPYIEEQELERIKESAEKCRLGVQKKRKVESSDNSISTQKDSKKHVTMSKIIFAIERFESLILRVSKSIKQPLVKYVYRSTSRDFRIQNSILESVMLET